MKIKTNLWICEMQKNSKKKGRGIRSANATKVRKYNFYICWLFLQTFLQTCEFWGKGTVLKLLLLNCLFDAISQFFGTSEQYKVSQPLLKTLERWKFFGESSSKYKTVDTDYMYHESTFNAQQLWTSKHDHINLSAIYSKIWDITLLLS